MLLRNSSSALRQAWSNEVPPSVASVERLGYLASQMPSSQRSVWPFIPYYWYPGYCWTSWMRKRQQQHVATPNTPIPVELTEQAEPREQPDHSMPRTCHPATVVLFSLFRPHFSLRSSSRLAFCELGPELPCRRCIAWWVSNFMPHMSLP